jgi:C-terminal processing protease CtpA/Prc
MKALIHIASAAFAIACIAAPLRAQTIEAVHSAAEIRSDLDQLLQVIDRTHPDLDFVADRPALMREANLVRARIVEPMTTRQAWLALAVLNPLFRDAHTGLRHPVVDFDAYRENGGAIFPIPVIVDREGVLRAGARVSPGSGLAPFEAITSINGQSATSIIAALMLRMRGETESLRRLVLAFNFPGHLWTLIGPQENYIVDVSGRDGTGRRVTLPSSTEAVAAENFALAVPRPGVAVMRIPSFDPSLREPFARFVEESFARIQREQLNTLLIDIRDNPGGAHDVSDLLVSRLTDRAVASASRLTARITEDNRDVSAGAPIGSVVTVPHDEQIEPYSGQLPYRGRVFVLVSANTYSQAIVFAATLQDHGLARLVGEPTGGAANQTGQITLHPLSHTGLQTLAPLYIIYRPSGDDGRAGLQPDILLPHDPADPDAMISRLLAVEGQQQPR